jgi:ribonuclease E
MLEHFTQAVRLDSARPQIAQLTELGLVELTRKRQGQNIYELFGRACPSCGGLGHVAVLPGRDTLQPLATVSGLVRTSTPTRSDVVSAPPAAEGGGGRRRRSGRGGRGGDAGDAAAYGTDATGLGAAGESDFAGANGAGIHAAGSSAAGGNGQGGVGEAASRRPEPELVAVPMDDDQEMVYGWLGLSPVLLLDPPPSGDNLMVRVVRPGNDPEAVLEEARQQLAASGSRRRRRGRGGGETRPHGGDGASEFPVEESAPALVEITPLPVEIPGSITQAELVTVAVPARAGGGRSSAATRATLVVAEEDQEAEEPRRRRRRSSATV